MIVVGSHKRTYLLNQVVAGGEKSVQRLFRNAQLPRYIIHRKKVYALCGEEAKNCLEYDDFVH
jgi:hypothetical protein